LVSSSGHLDLVRFFVEHGADTAAHDEDGVTPLHSASSRGHLDLARFLVEPGADAAAQDKDGESPLHLASSGGHLDPAPFLVDRGADAAARKSVFRRHWDRCKKRWRTIKSFVGRIIG
jgi:ankyrin repeat protein